MRLLPGLLLMGLLLIGGAPAEARRVVSLNLCTDQYLLLLAPEQAAGVTWLAGDPALSAMTGAAAGVAKVRADAEAVLRLAPDLVLAGPWGAREALTALERRGVPVLRIEMASDFPAIRARTREVAQALGVAARADGVIAAMDAVLAGVKRDGMRPALALQPRGWTSGPGSLMRAVMAAAGLRDTGTGGQLGLEALAAHPPPLLVVPETPAFPSLASEMLAHPVLSGIERRAVPPALVLCGGPWTAGAVALLAE